MVMAIIDGLTTSESIRKVTGIHIRAVQRILYILQFRGAVKHHRTADQGGWRAVWYMVDPRNFTASYGARARRIIKQCAPDPTSLSYVKKPARRRRAGGR